MENREIRNPETEPEPEPEPEPEQMNDSSSLLCIPRKMDDDTRSPFKKRYEYKEHSSYHSFQLQ